MVILPAFNYTDSEGEKDRRVRNYMIELQKSYGKPVLFFFFKESYSWF